MGAPAIMIAYCPPTTSAALEQEFSGLPGVKKAIVKELGDFLRVNVLMSDFAQANRFRVYDKEEEVFRRLHGLRFEVNVIDASAQSGQPTIKDA